MSELLPWPESSRRSLARFAIFDVIEARRRSPRTGQDRGFFLVDTWDWVNIVAFTTDDELLLVRQYRHGTSAFSLEIPGGVVHPGEDPQLAASRELREETGYATTEPLQRLGVVTSNPALFTNRCTTFLARACVRAGALQQDDGEDIEVVVMPLPAVEDAVRCGEIDHALVLAALYHHRLA
jgi:8-oxo-dGTP pyrophosphatase MutT (NUDIX family)